MTKDELIKCLKDIKNGKSRDVEDNHGRADDLLLAYIDDEEVTDVYESILKWYA